MEEYGSPQGPPLPKRKKKEPLIFTDEDYPLVLSPHRDALVVKIEINNVVVHRTLVDTGSSVNNMYNNTFKELGLSRGDLKPICTPLLGFTGDTIKAEGTITVKAGKEEGRPTAELAEEGEEVALDPAKPEQKLKVGRSLPLKLKEKLVGVLRLFKVLFAWGPGDMPGVDPRIIYHRLAVDPAHKPIKQKKCFLSSERRDFVTKQVTTLQSIGHIWEVCYQSDNTWESKKVKEDIEVEFLEL
ncbi:unnamed protein product [Cuscuta campestris]|uniref:Uncharacterized protein n=1 Tax=Cuscuta campestris TaxID=132261 RepID=A0A484M733_9ASTE|nr:unnamed protein product [Cuscuta campestris]